MKKRAYLNYQGIVILILILPQYVFAQSKWKWQNPLPQGADMFAVITLAQKKAIITGSGGTIMTTTDEGLNWKFQRLPKVDWVRKYSFISEYEGWIIGHWYDATNPNYSGSKIFKTINGGMDWLELDISINIDFDNYSVDDINFINDRVGYLLANTPYSRPIEVQRKYPGLIYKTEDGGLHWVKIASEKDKRYSQILFQDNLNGYLLYKSIDSDYYTLNQTKDGGTTWQTKNNSLNGILNFYSSLFGWAGNYKTTDGGNTWNYKYFNFPNLNNRIDKIWFTDSLTGYAISYRTILKTVDGGETWDIISETKLGLLQDIKFFDSKIGYVCGYGGTIYSTSDGGENWTRFGNGPVDDLNDIDFVDENNGWVVGNFGTILHTNDAGKNWQKQKMPDGCDSLSLRGINFLNKKKGWATGQEYVFDSEDGGENWSVNFKTNLVYEDIKGTFRDIKCLNDSIIIVVGQKGAGPFGVGVFFITTDGGKNWRKADNDNLPPLDKIYFVDNEYGWICGNQILLSTKDGGRTWRSQSFDKFLRYIQFTDREHGWISALDEGSFYRTTNNGDFWSAIPYEDRYYEFFSSFAFLNYRQGISSTFIYNNILTTDDGGLNWTYQERLPPVRINRMKFINDSTGWAVGTDGAILKFQGSYSDTTIIVQKPEIFTGSYPNPFNSKTTIFYYLTRPEDVSISIYNILGECVSTIFQTNTYTGLNKINWQPGSISSGIYLIRIQCSEFIKTVKCMFIK